MEYITSYSFQGVNISFYVEQEIIYFDASQISVPIGFWSENGIAYKVNMGERQRLAPHSKEVVLPQHKNKKTLMISEVGILHLNSKYSHKQYQDFLEWLHELKQNSIQLKNAIERRL